MIESASSLPIELPTGFLVSRINQYLIGFVEIINPVGEDSKSLLVEEDKSVLKYREEFFSLIDLYKIFGCEKPSNINSIRILVINHCKNMFAFYVDKIIEAITINQSVDDQLIVSDSNLPSFSCGLIKNENEEILILDFDKIIKEAFSKS